MATKSIAERKKALQAQISKLEEEERQHNETQYKIIGRVVSAEMETNQELMNVVGTLLERELKSNKERIAMNLEPKPTKRGRPSSDK